MQISAVYHILTRHRVITLGFMILSLGMMAGVYLAIPPVYEATSSYLLLKPPNPPTDAELEANPELKKLNSDNPYVRFSDPSVILNVVARRVSSEATKKALPVEGTYTVAPSSRFGYSSPILDVTIESDSASGAVGGSRIVGEEVIKDLDAVQSVEGVDKAYMYVTRPVEIAEKATVRSSGRLRAVVAVLLLVVIAFFALVIALQALDRRKAVEIDRPPRTVYDGESGLSPSEHVNVRTDRKPADRDGGTARHRWLNANSSRSKQVESHKLETNR